MRKTTERRGRGRVPSGDPLSDLPDEARGLLAVRPDEFVAQRAEIARSLRSDGRDAEARTVEKLRKPAAVVLAVNRAVKGRPQAAKRAVDAAERMQRSQLAGDLDSFDEGSRDLESALGELAEVALAHLSSRARPPSQALRNRLVRLLRAAVAEDEARSALVAGALLEELEAPGFDAFVGASFPRRSRRRLVSRGTVPRERRGAREEELRTALARAKEEAAAAEREAESAARRLERARRKVADVEAELEHATRSTDRGG